jgi:hypothetical protein
MLKIPLTEIKEDINKRKGISHTDWKVILLKAIPHKVVYRFNPIKVPAIIFTEINRLSLKVTRKCKGCTAAKPTLKENKVSRLTFLHFN